MFTVTNVAPATNSKKPPSNEEWAELLNQIAALSDDDQRAVHGALGEAIEPLLKGKKVVNKLQIGNERPGGRFLPPRAAERPQDRGFRLPSGDD